METELTIILIFSILFQLFAAGYSIYLINYTGFKYSWIFLSASLLLMSVRRAIPLYYLLSNSNSNIIFTSELLGLILSILILFGIIGIGRVIIERRNAEEKINSLLTEKEIILKEVHHRIKNNLNTTHNLLMLQVESSDKKEIKEALDGAASRVRAMLSLYEELFVSGHYTDVNLKAYLPLLCERVIANFPNRNKIKLSVESQEISLEEKNIASLSLIINELLTNIMKYAFIGKDSGEISISLIKNRNSISLNICDNGNGIPDHIDFTNSTGFGLSLVDMLTKQLEGKISFESNNGTKVKLEFPA